MTHSVSHSLIIEYNGNRLSLYTKRKDDVILEIKEYQNVTATTLTTILTNLPEVYSQIHCCLSQSAFIVIPEEFFEQDHQALFSLSYEIKKGQQLFLDKLDKGIGILYADDAQIHGSLLSKYPRINIKHEAGIVLSKIQKELVNIEEMVYLSVNEESILILCVRDKKIKLCNGYQTKSIHEIFYFVMLVYEQFHFVPSETELTILGEPKGKAELNELLQQYIRKINYRTEQSAFESGVSSKFSLNRSFATQLLVCE